jgi:hypothetical protein
LQGLVIALTVAILFVAPAVASATPQFRINGVLAGPATHNVVAVGSLTMNNKLFGEWKCKVLAGLMVENESEKGVATVESWEPFNCTAQDCPGSVTFRGESSPKLEEVAKGEKPLAARGSLSVPWQAELMTDEVGKTALRMRTMRLWLTCPSETFEPQFAGYIEPRLVNGIGNGLSPTHLLFEGKGGHTSWLNGTWLGGTETEETKLFFSGELTILGTTQELITAQ